MKPQISVILPTYNEAGNITALVTRIREFLTSYNYEIIICDDNSPDNTAGIAKKAFQNDKNVKVFLRRSGRGLANAISFGIENAEGDWILVMDTDFNHDPQMLPDMCKYINKFDLIVGSRYLSGGGMEDKIRYILSYLYNRLIKLLLNLPVTDSLSGFFLINKDKLKQLDVKNIFTGYGEYFIRLLYYSHCKGFKIKELPVYYKNRTAGISKSKFLPMLRDYSATVYNLIFHKQ